MASSSNYQRVFNVLIGDGVNSATASAVKASTIKEGDLFLMLEDNTIVATNAAASAIGKDKVVYIVQGTDDGFKKSSPLKGKNIERVASMKYVAPATQVTYLGYDGSSFEGLPILDEKEYVMNVLIENSERIIANRQELESYTVVTGLNATQSKLAFAMLSLFYAKDTNGTKKTYKNRFVDLAVINDGATEVASSTNATVTKNSVYVTFVGAHGFVAGDEIRIGTAGNGLDPIYKVKSVDTNAIYLTTPYVGASTTILASNIRKVTGATNYAFRLTAQTPVINGHDDYEIVMFDASFFFRDNGGTTPDLGKTTTVKAYFGAGFWKSVRDREKFAQGWEGVMSRTEELDYTVLNPKFYSQPNICYHTVIIDSLRSEPGSFQDTRTNPVAEEIYIPRITTTPVAGEQANGTAEDFIHILNGYLVSQGFTAISFA